MSENDPYRPYVIDADGHVTEPADLWEKHLEARFRERAPRFATAPDGQPCLLVDGRPSMKHALRLTLGAESSANGYTARPGGSDPLARMEDLDREGIDVAVLFPSVGLFVSDVEDPELMAAMCRAYNDWLADYCLLAPDRLIGVALLPLVDVAASVTELERATEEHGFRGAFFRPNPYAGRPIHHPDYAPLWECAAHLGVPITVHEGLSDWAPTLGRDRFDDPAMLHVVCHPFEQMSACNGLVMGGVLARHPALKVAFLESGAGWFPYWLHRMDEHWETWRRFFPGVLRRPSEYVRAQCVVSTEPGEQGIARVVELVGEEAVVWASDYPHPDATFPGALEKTLRAMTDLSEPVRCKVLADNAARLYGLRLPVGTSAHV